MKNIDVGEKISAQARRDWTIVVLSFLLPNIAVYIIFGMTADDVSFRIENIIIMAVNGIYNSVYLLLTFLIAGIAFDLLRNIGGRRAVRLPPGDLNNIISERPDELKAIPEKFLRRMRCVPSDIRVAAHVRGTIRPQIVISGGMVVDLLRKDIQSMLFLCHEVAHIKHWDRLLIPFFSISIASMFLGTITPIFSLLVVVFGREKIFDLRLSDNVISENYIAIIGVGVFLILEVSFNFFFITNVVRYREMYADAAVVNKTQFRVEYIKLLKTKYKTRGFIASSIYPSPISRAIEIENNFITIRRGVFWKIYWIIRISFYFFPAIAVLLYSITKGHDQRWTSYNTYDASQLILFLFVLTAVNLGFLLAELTREHNFTVESLSSK